MAVLAIGVPACAVRQHHEVVVIVQRDEPLRGYATGPLSLGESPSDLSAAQINAPSQAHGTWVDSTAHGRVWRPTRRSSLGGTVRPVRERRPVGRHRRRLVLAERLRLGAVAFHYGRWVLDGSMWSWVPGSRFAPGLGRLARGRRLGRRGRPRADRRARAWAPFVYCPHAASWARASSGASFTGAAASSLYARTSRSVDRRGHVPRGPEAHRRGAARVGCRAGAGAPGRAHPSRALRPLGADGLGRGRRLGGAHPGRSSTPRGAAGGRRPGGGPVAVVIRDRDLAGMSAGPSVRRPAGAPGILPIGYPRSARRRVVIVASGRGGRASRRGASAAASAARTASRRALVRAPTRCAIADGLRVARGRGRRAFVRARHRGPSRLRRSRPCSRSRSLGRSSTGRWLGPDGGGSAAPAAEHRGSGSSPLTRR